jgi:hypothetical protein
MLDLDHQTRIGTLEKALWQLGKQMASEGPAGKLAMGRGRIPSPPHLVPG